MNWGEDSSQDQPFTSPEDEEKAWAAFGMSNPNRPSLPEFSPGNGYTPLAKPRPATEMRSMPTVRAADVGKQNHTGWVRQMNDEDLMNDALDGQIQQAISRSRGNTLQGLVEQGADPEPDNDLDDSITNQMIAEDEEEEKKKKASGGGGGLGAIAGMAGSFMGG